MQKLTAIAFFIAATAQAADVNWDSTVPGCTSSDFANASCWDAQTPDQDDRVVFTNDADIDVFWTSTTYDNWKLQTGSTLGTVKNDYLELNNSTVDIYSDTANGYIYKLLLGLTLNNSTLNFTNAANPMNLQINPQVGNGSRLTTDLIVENSTLNLSGPKNKIDIDNPDIIVGLNGTGVINLTNGGKILEIASAGQDTPETRVGANAGSNGTINVDGAGSWLDLISADISLGESGSGTLNVTNGGKVEADIRMGLNAGSVGVATASGEGSELLTTRFGTIYVGQYGDATLNVNDGATIDFYRMNIGFLTNSVGSVTLDNAVYLDNGVHPDTFAEITVGDLGNGTLNILNGTKLPGPIGSSGNTIEIASGNNSTGTLLIDGIGSSLSSGALIVGNGDAILTISNGGTLEIGNSSSIEVGQNFGATGSILVDGPGSSFTTSGSVLLGEFGTADMQVTNGAMVIGNINTNAGLQVAGFGDSGTATLLIDGPGSVVNMDGSIGLNHNSTTTITNGGALIGNGISLPANGGSLTMDSGFFEAWQLNIRGDFFFTGGTINADHFTDDLINTGGVVNPAPTAAYLTQHSQHLRDGMDVWGDYRQGKQGALVIEIDGFTARSQYDQLDVEETAFLDGHLEVVLNDSLTINEGDTFDILLAETIVGQFATIGNACINDNLRWAAIYRLFPDSPDKVRLRAVATGGTCNNDPLPVLVDVDPWSETNEVAPESTQLIAVAIMGTSVDYGQLIDFDVTDIDPDSLKLGGFDAPTVSVVPLYGDYDNDTQQDVAFSFRTEETGIICGQDDVNLSGETFSGVPFAGSSTITTVDCESGGCHP